MFHRQTCLHDAANLPSFQPPLRPRPHHPGSLPLGTLLQRLCVQAPRPHGPLPQLPTSLSLEGTRGPGGRDRRASIQKQRTLTHTDRQSQMQCGLKRNKSEGPGRSGRFSRPVAGTPSHDTEAPAIRERRQIRPHLNGYLLLTNTPLSE